MRLSKRTRGVLRAVVLATGLVFNCQGMLAASNSKGQDVNVPQVQGTLQQTSLMGVDPKTGKTLWKATAKAVDAQTGAGGDAIGTMHDAVVTLYQHGVAEAVMTAPTVKGDLGTRTVTATGGVRVKTLSGSGGTVTCDRVVWHSDTNMMLGTGHVVVRGKGFVQTGPSFLADTKMESVRIPAPGYGTGVHGVIGLDNVVPTEHR